MVNKIKSIFAAIALILLIGGSVAGAEENVANCNSYKDVFSDSGECAKKIAPLATLAFDDEDLVDAAKKAFGKDVVIPYAFRINKNVPEVIGFKKITVEGLSPYGKEHKMDKLWFNGSTFVIGGVVDPKTLKKKKPAHGKYGEFIGWRLADENGRPMLGLEKDGVILGGLIVPLLNRDAVTVFSEMSAWQKEVKEGRIDFPNKKTVSKMIMERIKKTPSIVMGSGENEIYVFHDPFCHYCKRFYNEIRPLIKQGKIKVHWIEIGALGERSMKAAEWIISQGDSGALDRWEAGGGKMPVVFSGSQELEARVIAATKLFETAGGIGTPFIVIEKNNGTGIGITGYVNPMDLIEYQKSLNNQ